MDREETIKTILTNNNFNNFKIVRTEAGSRCDYKKDGISTVYLSQDNDYEDANSFIVAAHEASHLLNYRDRKTNLLLLKTLEKMYKFFVLLTCIVIILDFFLYLFDPLPLEFIMYLLICIHSFFTVFYLLYYLHDEKITEKRSLVELKEIWNDQCPIPFSKLEKENQYRLRKWVYFKTSALLLVMLVFPWFAIFIFSILKSSL